MRDFTTAALGRFVQADSIVPGMGNPNAFDRFAYVQNNPINCIDPAGHIDCPYWLANACKTVEHVVTFIVNKVEENSSSI